MRLLLRRFLSVATICLCSFLSFVVVFANHLESTYIENQPICRPYKYSEQIFRGEIVKMRIIMMVILLACQFTVVAAQIPHILPWSPGELSPINVTQSNNFKQYKATFATDRNLKTESVAVPVNGEVWFKVDYGKSHFIHKIVIYQVFWSDFYLNDNWCVKSPNNYASCKDSHRNVDVSVYLGEEHQKSCGTLQLTNELEQADQIYTFFCDVEGDSIRLSKKSEQISIYEIVVTSLQGEILHLRAFTVFPIPDSSSLPYP